MNTKLTDRNTQRSFAVRSTNGSFGIIKIEKDAISISSEVELIELGIDEVEGYRYTNRMKSGLEIVPISREKGKISFNVKDEEREELGKWLTSNFDDVNEVRKEKELNEIYNSPQFGATLDERKNRFESAVSMTNFINLLSCVSFIIVFLKAPFYVVLALPVTIFLIAVYFYFFKFKGLVTINQAPGSVRPSFIYSLFGLTLTTFIFAELNFKLVEPISFLLLAIPIGGVLFGVLFLKSEIESHRRKNTLLPSIIFKILFSIVLAGSSLVIFNCSLDRDRFENVPIVIVDKVVKTGKTKSYYLILGKPIKAFTSNELQVSRDFFDSVNESETLNIKYHEGYIGIPWYELDKIE
ncbi:hypothetical protein [Aureibacter tunicatorum]|uniref:NADH:ubiquinone oxidoreductase subunit 6 (Subunit J) n=1 Tax=Aureibacter tunicatorum TaxID=866807 RepID=A0AAE3XQB0_9BACT|nr:hypothetical protein [Aureibacter tunicatorum]MDR6240090.1 NADH:ubiquinone oxidoreductase subunit 6 (subunit J) [Aureibacter tunicatorum]BDD04561.1 hypothetical protein AUTU_20440 [Aureibacter tunicatorum]